ncbi:MAG: aminopeptidase P family protein [Acidobacteria bacterium]|nr:aminopeptidase P family protein [Acidobacteriota bacterium]
MSTRSRIATVRERLGDLDGLLVTSLPNIRYLTGFTGSNAIVLITRRKAVLFTDPRYTLQSVAETAGSGIQARTVKGPLELTVVKKLKGLRKVGFESGTIGYASWEHFAKAAPLEPSKGLVESLRLVKSEDEIAAICASVDTNSQAFTAAIGRFRSGMSELDLAAEIDYQMRLLGAEKPAFETIVAFKANSALPHARPGAAKIDRNGLLLIDMGSFRGGYASDMTRCLHLGAPAVKTRQLYRAVLEAQLAAIDAVRPGVKAGSIDKAARGTLEKHGLAKAFVHSTGHGLGLEIHETPRIGKGDKTKLAAGMAITIEPGAYLRGHGGVRIEDTVLVTPTGVEILTPTPKQLTIL